MAIPLLALHLGSSSSATSVHAQALAPASVTHDAFPRASRSAHRVLAAPTADDAVVVPEPTTTTAPIPTTQVTYKALVIHRRPSTTTSTTAKPKPKPKPTTTTTRPPSTSTAPSSSGSSTTSSEDPHYGKASWYEDAPLGTCAHKTLPKGTVVTVTDLDTGKTVQCTVADRGPYVDGYIIDLSKDTFEKLAPLSQGVVRARIDW